MSEGKSELVRTTEKRVREIFEAAGYEVSEAVGDRPGEVVFFAEEPQRAGRLRIHWVVWERCPDDLDGALDVLDQVRTRLGADRAMAVVAQGNLPAGYRHDLHANRVNAFTLRRLAFELLGVFEFMHRAAEPPADAPHHPDQFLPRRGVTEHGDTVSAVEYIETILDREGPWLLLVEDEKTLGQHSLLAHVAYRRARACLADSEHGTPPLMMTGLGSWWSPSVREIIAPDVVWYLDDRSWRLPFDRGEMPFRGCVSVSIDHRGIERLAADRPVFSLRLLSPDEHEFRAWYRSHLPEPAYAQLDMRWERSADIAAIARHLANLVPVRMAAMHATQNSDTPQAWLARFVIHYASHQMRQYEEVRVAARRRERLPGLIEDTALEEFALGRASPELADILQGIKHTATADWFELDEKDRSVALFANRLIRDYFLARKIVREVREHGPSIFARYQFPQEHVLLFLAVVAPEVSAQATADRSAEMRARIEEEIEHRLQLTLAHQLKRSVGDLDTNLGRVRRALPEAVRTQYVREFVRIDDELGFLKALAENTRRWHEVPDETREDFPVAAAIESALSQLREKYDVVEIALAATVDTVVRADRLTLHEILYCLLENAFHAACDPAASQPPRVEVRAVHEGADVVRIEVLDSGPGVDPGDRERIFEPRVTTKKGGPGRPQGTGMGLAIARKYAHALGGRVELDSEQPQTCFVLKLVAGEVNRE